MAYDGKSISFVKLVMDIMIGVVSKIRIMRIEDVSYHNESRPGPLVH